MNGPGQAQGYEFAPHENVRIAKLAKRTRRWGIVALILSLLGMAAFALVWFVVVGSGAISGGWVIAAFIAMAPVLLVNGVIAFLYMGAGKSLQAVVDTQHEDVPHLLDAMGRLSGAFRIEAILGSIGIIAGAIGLWATLRGE